MLKYFIDIEFKDFKKGVDFISDNEFIFDLPIVQIREADKKFVVSQHCPSCVELGEPFKLTLTVENNTSTSCFLNVRVDPKDNFAVDGPVSQPVYSLARAKTLVCFSVLSLGLGKCALPRLTVSLKGSGEVLALDEGGDAEVFVC